MRSRPAVAVLTALLCAAGAGGTAAAVPGPFPVPPAPVPAPAPYAGALVGPGCAVPLAGLRAPVGSGCAALGLAGRGGRAVPGTAGAGPVAEPCTPGIPQVDDRCEVSVGGYDAGDGDGPGDGLGSGEVVAASPDGATGWTAVTSRVSADDTDLVVLAQDGATGTARWAARVASLAGHPRVTAITLTTDPEATAVYTAVVAGADNCDTAAVVAHDATTGVLRWTSTEPAPDGGCVSVQALETDPAGRQVVVVGHTTDADGVSRSWVEALDAVTGATVWSAADEGGFPAGQQASALAHAPDGRSVYVAAAGRRASGGGHSTTHAWTVTAYDAGTGSARPVGRWDAPKQQASHPANPPAGVRVTPDGSRVVVTGGAEGRTLFDITTVAFDTATGVTAWQTAYEGIRGQYIKSSFDSVWYHRPLGLSPDGRRAYVAGYSTSLHGVNLSMDFVTLAYDVATGATVWTARRTSSEWMNWLPSISVAPDGGRVFLSGQSRHFQLITAHYETVAHDAATGDVAWVGRYADGLAYWSGAALSGDGSRLFVAGRRVPRGASPDSASSYQAVTVAYAAR